ncbi:hypothetical protein [Demequina rhizosphaerae]|uniref:hypothetical protein n=1 Tax=Demequina rhizosphaerae TaxID=1638985 RepID=UPI00078592DA|nr:hypothetical protein [Demequina rhizosphaerae]
MKYAESVNSDWLSIQELALRLYGACMEEIATLRASGVTVDHYNEAREAWLRAIVVPDVAWNAPATASEALISAPSLALLRALGAQIEQFYGQAGAHRVNFNAVRQLCDDVDSMLEHGNLPDHVRTFIGVLLEGVRDALAAEDPLRVVQATLSLLGSLAYFGRAEPEADWSAGLMDFLTQISANAVGGLMVQGVTWALPTTMALLAR